MRDLSKSGAVHDDNEFRHLRPPVPLSFRGRCARIGLHRGFGDTFAKQLDDTFVNLRQTLAEFDLTLAHLDKVYVWLEQIEDLPEMEKSLRNSFGEGAFPARITATTAFIDDDCMLIIDGVAYRGS
jgi:2-iminobutanoate/2-iminopropanoate deaminase